MGRHCLRGIGDIARGALRQESLLPTDIYPAAPRTFGKRTHDESAEPYSREELIRDKAREDARTIDGEDI
jgi:hypothetical protein